MNIILQRKKSILMVIFLSMIFAIALNILPTKASILVFLALMVLPVIALRSEIGVYLAVLMMPFINFKYISLLIFYSFGSFLVKTLYQKKKLKITKIDGPLLLFSLTILMSSVFSITLVQSIKELFYYISIILAVFMISKSFDKKKLNYLLLCFLLAAVLVSIIGIHQYMIGDMGHQSWVDKKVNPDLKARAYSTMDNPNILAEYLVIACSMGLVLFIDSKNFLRKVLVGIFTAVNVLCLLLTFSRGGWVGFAIAVLIIILFEENRLIPIGMLIGIISLFFLPEVVIDRIKSIGNLHDSSNAYRFLIWSAALKMFKDFWLSGVGLGYGAFIKAYPNYMLAGVKAAHAHNMYLQVAIETGILGLLTFLYSVLKAYGIGILNILKSNDKFFKRLSVASIGALSGLLFHGLVEHVLFDYRIVFAFWLIIGIIVASWNEKAVDS
ncbi:O-antigen ligase [Caminicella sporogenes DSM 14501]|uniref:O-antigen ligase n=1 Tax=Caminicella sporogenes DSM 14501 TaxID=1121266 RepID=A0A1M6QGV0_9FIRM|nr:O-antigen ligase family protein [Caminicella sporogenes]RKD25317.1 hypothetical protein BET04_03650 [Caminicella sporogenes]SHK19451.1 O-antigen ligase [Caminicella sporogenes DSM 14501]